MLKKGRNIMISHKPLLVYYFIHVWTIVYWILVFIKHCQHTTIYKNKNFIEILGQFMLKLDIVYSYSLNNKISYTRSNSFTIIQTLKRGYEETPRKINNREVRKTIDNLITLTWLGISNLFSKLTYDL